MSSGNFLTTFSDGTNSYTFPAFQSQLRDNFSDMVPRTVRIPGADGGFDQFGVDKAPSEIGNVSVSFEQYADGNEDLQTKRDLVRAMAAWGVATLTKDCGAEGTRFCSARVNSITMTEAPNQPIESQKLTVTVDFQVAEPYWLEIGTWDSPLAILANNTNQAVNSVGGLFKTYPKFTLTVTGASASFIQIIWGTGGADVREVILSGFAAVTGDVITIDCRTMEVTHTGVNNAFSYVTFFRHANFIWLDPGNNIIKINPSGATITATIAWYERY